MLKIIKKEFLLQTEYHYIITFTYRVVKPLFKDFNIGLTWGEKSLRCSTILCNKTVTDVILEVKLMLL
ncbi:hypothetical protein F8M41_015764 [Gigaspora margarita]|uniref:Uncharacterized protein n=1 Tax=Gigaspora margarita TaxID=4874 RepID=A0A8H3ZZ72_GIGMA|nr:hypothetical protein F8M41_015764 [Gigaspora margarita]